MGKQAKLKKARRELRSHLNKLNQDLTESQKIQLFKVAEKKLKRALNDKSLELKD